MMSTNPKENVLENDTESAGPTDFQRELLNKSAHCIKLPFPYKVHEMLEQTEATGQSHIVSWLPHGKSFRVHMEKEFVDSIMTSYFDQSKFTSFTRQLYIYGFQKVRNGPDKGAFFQKQFVRANKYLCLSMKRKPDKPAQKQKQASPKMNQSCLSTIEGRQCQRSSSLMDGSASSHLAGTYLLKQPQQNFSIGPSSSAESFFQQAMQKSPQTLTDEALQGTDSSFRGIMHHDPIHHDSTTAFDPLCTSMAQVSENTRACDPIDNQEGTLEEDWLAVYERLTAVSDPRASSSNGQFNSVLDGSANSTPSACMSNMRIGTQQVLANKDFTKITPRMHEHTNTMGLESECWDVMKTQWDKIGHPTNNFASQAHIKQLQDNTVYTMLSHTNSELLEALKNVESC